MEHFADVLLNRKYNLSDEIIALQQLFKNNQDRYSLNDIFEEQFLNWPLRSTYVDFDTFFRDTGLSKIYFTAQHKAITIEDYIFFCEYMLNVITFDPLKKYSMSAHICDNIMHVLNELNYKVHITNNIYHVIERNILVAEAADAVQDNYDLGESIYSFNYRENKGDVRKKADVLCRLYKYLEDIEKQARSYGYSNLVDDTKELSNKLNIRHAPTQRQTDVINGMKKAEYETWLDELFKLFLSLIVLVDYTEKRKDIKALKAELG